MADPIRIPGDFRAIVFTAPARVDNTTIPRIQQHIKKHKLEGFDGHRILHMHQAETVDSAAVATLLKILEISRRHGREFVICDPPPIMCSHLEIYGAHEVVETRVLSSAEDGTYTSDLLPFIPPFVPLESGRIDIYRDGEVTSWEMGGRDLKRIAPVNLDAHPPKAPTRAHHMAVEDEPGQPQELKATGYVQIRKHNCGCDTTHSTFRRLHELHAWFRRTGFGFRSLELWASDVPSGLVTEKLTFDDHESFEKFQSRLKEDTGWQQIGAPMDDMEEEFYYIY